MSGLYFHIPFCSKRCNYCNFYFSLNKNLIPVFLNSLKIEIQLASPLYQNTIFDTIYFGGGTPSLLSNEELTFIINLIKDNFRISNKIEFTLEANPEDLNESKIINYSNAGINRLSLGIQSLVNEELNFLSRQHNSETSVDIIKTVKKYFKNFSLDLIYSLPGQSFKSIKQTIDKYIELDSPHISAYTLTFEEKTLMHKNLQDKLINKNSTDYEAELFLNISEYLKSSGYDHYEVSSFAKQGFESIHNSKYWTYNDYIGFGPSAHSFFNNQRWNNFTSLGRYNKSLDNRELPIENKKILLKEESKTEFLALSLRYKGINFEKYEMLFDEDFKSVYSDVIKILKKNNLAVESENFIKLTDKGYLLADEICSRYF